MWGQSFGCLGDKQKFGLIHLRKINNTRSEGRSHRIDHRGNIFLLVPPPRSSRVNPRVNPGANPRVNHAIADPNLTFLAIIYIFHKIATFLSF